ncbi:MAG TPA: hypothetical protein VGI45_19110 [Terracidiphilus sp.]
MKQERDEDTGVKTRLIRLTLLRFTMTLLTLAPALSAAAQQGEHKRFTNDDVVSMVQMRLSEEVIVAKIRAMNGTDPDSLGFDTSVQGLQALKAANVPDGVIRVMINPSPQATVVAPAAPMTLDPNLPPPEVGVYWRDESRFVLIEGQVLSNTKIGGKAGSMFSYGLRGLHWDATLSGPTSSHIVRDHRPVFYLYVPDGGSSSDYALLKLNKKGNRREFQIGSLGGRLGGGKSGLKSDKEVSFEAAHVGIRTYKVTLSEDLKPGEYAFFMATGQQVNGTQGRGTGGAATGRIYDFRLPE